ncbi:MAG: hypothetical protein H0T57_09255 [Rubrobacter sp.]|jgi:hypothetical protein|nr:hypothetical protein [Rubrobacter sp.]MBA3614713.1 hypothetical protein [Rubrobacteraceae bacterium]
MPRCSGVKRDNSQCERIVGESNAYCFAHDPLRKEERSANASKAGKGNRSKVSKDLHTLLEDLTERVVGGGLEPYPASVAGQLVGVRLRLLEYERKLKEVEEIDARLEELEVALEKQKGRAAHG